MKSASAAAIQADGRVAANDNSFNRTLHLHPGHKLYSSKDTIKELLAATPSNRYDSRGRPVEFKDGKWVRIRRGERAVFDIAHELPRTVDRDGEWTPPRMVGPKGVPVFRFGIDGPSDEHRLRAQASWITSSHHRGQLDAERKDWPLAKLLRAENNDHCLRLAERYRDLHDAVNHPWSLAGRDIADNVYLMSDTRLDESTGKLVAKGTKKVTGKKVAVQETEPTRSVKTDPDKTKKRAKAMPKKWQGDWPILNAIDASRELAQVQMALGWLREAFEAAAVYGDTLEVIGRRHGVGNEAGAKGGGRALVYLALQCVDEFWGKPVRRAA